jgi:rhomboid protease GluP
MDARGGRYIPWVTIVIAAANVIVFAIEVAAGGDLLWGPSPMQLLDLGGNFGPWTLGGEQWRLFTSMFLHVGLIHLALNMFMGLYQIGQHVERMYGRLGYAALYLFAGLAGSLASAIRSQAVSAGASGAIFGILGAYAAYLLLHRKRLDQTALKKQVQSLVFVLAINLYLGFQAKGIDMAAHMGGLGAGFLAGLALEAGASAVRQRVLRAVLVGVVGSALVVGAAVVVEPGAKPVIYGEGAGMLMEHLAAAERARVATDEHDDDAEPKVRANRWEYDVLPAWRSVLAELEADTSLPAEERRLARRYVELRAQQIELMVDGFRRGDSAVLARAAELGQQADEAVTELNKLLAR